MKKFICSILIVLSAVIFFCEFAQADPPPLFYISNLREISGGNNNAKLIVSAAMTFNGKTDLRGGGAEVDILGGRAARRPVNRKTPSAKDGLINQDAPIILTANGNTITFAFDDYQYVGQTMRVLDSKGNVLGNVPDEHSKFTLQLSSQEQDYYVEIKDYGGYCYVLVKAKTGPVYKEASTNRVIYEAPAELQKIYDKHQPIAQAYMKEHSIKDMSDLTQQDHEVISKRFMASLTPSERELLLAHGNKVQSIISSYMKEHSISDQRKLTVQDWNVINERIQKADAELIQAPAKTSSRSQSASTKKAKKKRK